MWCVYFGCKGTKRDYMDSLKSKIEQLFFFYENLFLVWELLKKKGPMNKLFKLNKTRELKTQVVNCLMELLHLSTNNWFLNNMSTIIMDYLSPLFGFSDVIIICCLLLLHGSKYIISLLLILIINPPDEVSWNSFCSVE